MFLFKINGSSEGSYDLSHVKVYFDVSKGTVSNQFYHAASAPSMPSKIIVLISSLGRPLLCAKACVAVLMASSLS